MRSVHDVNETFVASTYGLLVESDRVVLNAHTRQSFVLKINRSPYVHAPEFVTSVPVMPVMDEMLPVWPSKVGVMVYEVPLVNV